MNEEMLKLPKKFCENINGGFNKEQFIFGIFSGKDPEMYVLTPAHTKRLALWMTAQIALYEKQFGEIDPNLLKSTVSPIQFSDPSQNHPGKSKDNKK